MGGSSMDRYSVSYNLFKSQITRSTQFRFFFLFQQTGASHSRNMDLHMESRSSMDSIRNNGNRERFSPHYHGNGHSSHHSNSHSSGSSSNSSSHQSSSPQYCPDGSIKSDSPSRKRRRVSSRIPSQSPPVPWEPRQSPRNQQNQPQMQQQHSPIMRRRLRDQQRPWDPIPSLLQTPNQMQHNQQQHQQSSR